jgi:hypothetical protein
LSALVDVGAVGGFSLSTRLSTVFASSARVFAGSGGGAFESFGFGRNGAGATLRGAVVGIGGGSTRLGAAACGATFGGGALGAGTFDGGATLARGGALVSAASAS